MCASRVGSAPANLPGPGKVAWLYGADAAQKGNEADADPAVCGVFALLMGRMPDSVLEADVATSIESGSRVSPLLIAAYRATHFCVSGVQPPFILRVDESNADLANCYTTYGVRSSAFITAWNPGSQPTSDADNAAAQHRLESLLREQHFQFLHGLGVDPTGQWEGEESYLVLGIDQEAACDVGRLFHQHGIVWAGPDAVPHLIMLQ
jgi:hypothetical protein